MFYSSELFSKKGPFGKVWLAGTLRGGKKLTKKIVTDADIVAISNNVMDPTHQFALRIRGILLLGIVVIYEKKTNILLSESNDVLYHAKGIVSTKHGNLKIDLADSRKKASFDAITLPDLDNFLFGGSKTTTSRLMSYEGAFSMLDDAPQLDPSLLLPPENFITLPPIEENLFRRVAYPLMGLVYTSQNNTQSNNGSSGLDKTLTQRKSPFTQLTFPDAPIIAENIVLPELTLMDEIALFEQGYNQGSQLVEPDFGGDLGGGMMDIDLAQYDVHEITLEPRRPSGSRRRGKSSSGEGGEKKSSSSSSKKRKVNLSLIIDDDTELPNEFMRQCIVDSSKTVRQVRRATEAKKPRVDMEELFGMPTYSKHLCEEICEMFVLRERRQEDDADVVPEVPRQITATDPEQVAALDDDDAQHGFEIGGGCDAYFDSQQDLDNPLHHYHGEVTQAAAAAAALHGVTLSGLIMESSGRATQVEDSVLGGSGGGVGFQGTHNFPTPDAGVPLSQFELQETLEKSELDSFDENSHLTKKSQRVLEFLNALMAESADGTVKFSSIAPAAITKRSVAARSFYQVLVLANKKKIGVTQEASFEDIIIRAPPTTAV